MSVSACSRFALVLALGAVGSSTPLHALRPAGELPRVRLQLEEFTFEVDEHGNTRPIDHQVIDVFEMVFENQYGSIDRTSEHGDYGAVYFEVPAQSGGVMNHNIYLYMRDGNLESVSDGYHNGNVQGAMFKQTAMIMRRDGAHVRARIMHAINPRTISASASPDQDLVTMNLSQEIQRRIEVFQRVTRVQ